MSKYAMNFSEVNDVGNQIAAQYDALEGLIGELNRAVGLTYAASGFGVGEIRYNISQQKVLIENQMENLVLIQKALSDIKECTKDYENGARNLIWKAIIIEEINSYLDRNGDGKISWNDSLAFIEELLSYLNSVSDISDLIQILSNTDIPELNDLFTVLGPILKTASILFDLADGDWGGAAETAVKWLAMEILKTGGGALAASGAAGVAASFGVGFLISWAWNAGEAIGENVNDAINGEGVFADGFDATDILVIGADVVVDSAGETVWGVAHGVVQGVSVVASWITGGETYDEANPEMATYEGFKDSVVEVGEGLVWLASEWLS